MTSTLFETEVDNLDQEPSDPMSEPVMGSDFISRSDCDVTP